MTKPDPFDEVTLEKFNEVADAMDAEWEAMKANPMVQMLFGTFAEAILSEQGDEPDEEG